MHPALSVIFFTTSSGAGYGLLAWLGLFYALGRFPDNQMLGLVGVGLALALVTAGLLSSTFHLGHPERAWRAMSQWRSSWLSREGVLAIATYPPALALGVGWGFLGAEGGAWALIGLLTSAFALITVFSTAMIYASLPTIRQWRDGMVVPGYLTLALGTGAVLLVCLTSLFGSYDRDFLFACVGVLVVAMIVKGAYWRSIDDQSPLATSGTATGLGNMGRVRLLEGPSTSETYVMREMGYRVARKHATKLRRISMLLLLVLPIVCLLGADMLGGDNIRSILSVLAVASAGLGVFVERWLFFAEASHVVTTYFGAEKA